MLDAATGDAVHHHFFALVAEKLQNGFVSDFDNIGGKTLLFVGREDHLIPSTSCVLLDGLLFRVAGRMIRHNFLNGGPPLTGLSPALFHLVDGSPSELVTVEVEDCEVSEVVGLLIDSADHSTEEWIPKELSAQDRHTVNQLCMSRGLPRVSNDNWKILAESLLKIAVINDRTKQMKQLKKELKDTGVLEIIKGHPALTQLLFPRT